MMLKLNKEDIKVNYLDEISYLRRSRYQSRIEEGDGELLRMRMANEPHSPQPLLSRR